jgi:serine/threonine-protein kinase
VARTIRIGSDPPPPAAARESNGLAVDPAQLLADKNKRPRARRCPACDKCFSGEVRFCPFDGDALIDAPDWNPNADPLIGQVIDTRYEVVSVLGEGGTGSVYEVRHTTLGRRFALKILRKDIARDAQVVTRFIQEAKAAAAIGHPNIVAVSDFGEVQPDKSAPLNAKVPYFVMELLTGASLANLLRTEKKIAPDRAASIGMQCALGLAAAHEAGVIHRDLKPDNVFLVRSGDREFVKLLDFGLAKIAGTSRVTRQGVIFGTPHYMSPEQAAGLPVDHRSDVYALGVILYECITGRVPFEADSYKAVLDHHMKTQPVPLEERAPDPSLVGPLGPVVMRCLAKNPADRYATMAELAAALEEALAEMPRTEEVVPAAPARADTSAKPRKVASASAKPAKAAPAATAAPAPEPQSRSPLAIGIGAAAIVAIGFLGWRMLGAEQTNAQRQQQQPAPTPVTAAPPPAPHPVTPTAVAPQPTATQPAATGIAPQPTGVPPFTGTVPNNGTGPHTTTKFPNSGSGSTGTNPTPTATATTKKRGGGGGDIIDPWQR